MEYGKRHGNNRVQAQDLGMPLPIAPAHIFPWQATGTFSSVGPCFNLSPIAGISGYLSGPVFYGRVHGSTSILSRLIPTVHAVLDF